ncbi:endolytic transglycosylase MltG [Planococcaceae bacterium Storch 2/2-2]|nr:endolytic transglycosylase MltG [Planococcaceae bacterium Storch 2/2-2]
MSKQQYQPSELVDLELRQKEAKQVRKIVSTVALVLAAILLIGGGGLYFYVSSALKPYDKKDDEPIVVDIPIGSGLSLIAQTLEDEGVIKSARIFKYYAKFNNESEFQAGTYSLTRSMTPNELLETLKTGQLYREPTFQMTIPEGLTINEIAEIVEEHTDWKASDFKRYVNDPKTIKTLQEKYPSLITDDVLAEDIKTPLEGYLFPATYPFYEENPPIEEMVDVMLAAMADNLAAYLADWNESGRSVHELLTFASLLEKEATATTDRETIASVFYNRIAEDMPLQTDPTVLYSLGKHKDRVLYKDLEVEDPYNTYLNKGLPPGPIAAPGASSIEASVYPAETNYLYFLADKDGNNHFAHTYDEHLQNEAEYIAPQYEDEE